MSNIVKASSLNRDPLKADFKNFLWKAWMTLFGNAPSQLQYDMADWLQYGGGNSRDILMGFRGAAKSYIVVVYCLWCLWCDRDEIILTVSATSKFAGNNAHFAYQLINTFDWLADLKPRGDQRQSALAFDVNGAKPKKSESFCAESLFGQITGRRATKIVPDDVEIPSTSDTEGKRQLLLDRYGELGGAILLPGGAIKTLGTAQTEQTLYLELVNSRGYSMRMFPIQYPEIADLPKYGSFLAPRISQALMENPELAGTSTEPGRFDEADIAARRLEWGLIEFSRQFNLHLDAGAGNASPLKLRDLIVLDWGPPLPGEPLKLPPELTWMPSEATAVPGIEVDSLNGDSKVYLPANVSAPDLWMKADWVKCWVDPSGGGTDETTWTIVAHLSGRGFLCHQGADLRGHSKPVLDAIARDCKLWGVSNVKVEGNFGQDMFATLLIPAFAEVNHPVLVESESAGQALKEKRIVDQLEPVITAHRMVVNLRVLKADFHVDYPEVEAGKRRFYRLTYQLTRITRLKGSVKHDDRVEGMANAAGMLTSLLRQETEEAQKANKAKMVEREAQRMAELRKSQGLPTFGAFAEAVSKIGRGGGRSGSHLVGSARR